MEPTLVISGFMTRTEIWLLAVFTEGVLALLGAFSVGIGVWAGSRGVRDFAREEDAGASLSDEPRGGAHSVLGVTALGLCLLSIYAVGWLITRT
jgi:hypothetical protein